MYTNKYLQAIVPEGTTVLGAETISAAAAVHGQYLVTRPGAISQIGFFVTTLVASDTLDGVVEFNRRPTPGSGTGEVQLGTLTIPDGTAVGKLIVKDITPVKLVPGDALSLELLTQCTDASSAAGAGYYFFTFAPEEEEIANLVNVTASA